MVDARKEVFERVFKRGYIYKFHDSDLNSLIMILRIWADKRTMSGLVKEYWAKIEEHNLNFEEFLDKKGVIYEDVDIEDEFTV